MLPPTTPAWRGPPSTTADIVDHHRIFGLVVALAASRAATSPTDTELVELRAVHESFVTATGADAQASWNHESTVASTARAVRDDSFRCLRWSRAACRCAPSSSCQGGRTPRPATARGLAFGILQEMGYWERNATDGASGSGAA